jgi:hypothetical protein
MTKQLFKKYSEILVSIFLIFTVLFTSGCLQQKAAGTVLITPTPMIEKIKDPDLIENPKTEIEKISNEIDTLKFKGWDRISSRLGRTKSTTLLWNHIKKTYNIDTRMVFGNPNKLETVIAIPVKSAGDSKFPIVRIKSDDFYIIEPMTPVFLGEFNYGYMFDDPSSNYLEYGSFRLTMDDIDYVKTWGDENGIDLKYGDIKAK